MIEQFAGVVPILTYHRVVPDLFDHALASYRLLHIALSVNAFEKQMRYLQTHHTVMPLRDAVSALAAREPLPANACVITFDDSSREHYQYALPILKRFGFPATFFLDAAYTAEASSLRPLDRFYHMLDHSRRESFSLNMPAASRIESCPLNESSKRVLVYNSELKAVLKKSDASTQEAILSELEKALDVKIDAPALSRALHLSLAEMHALAEAGMDLGAHTVHHPSLLYTDIATARREIFESGDFVKKISGADNVAFAYPFGEAYDSPSINRLVRDYGYYAACTTVDGVNTSDTNRFALKRLEMTEETI